LDGSKDRSNIVEFAGIRDSVTPVSSQTSECSGHAHRFTGSPTS
jgi:hypothetical protein